ncbi:hypothetical protein D9M68_564760 [compost metagenome]
MEVAQVVVVHVGRRVQRTQRAVQRQRRFGVALADALAHLHLHEVAGGDHLLGALHGRKVVGLGEAALGRVRLRGLHDGRAHRVLELVLQLAQAALAHGIGLGLLRVGVDDQVELARQVVDDREFFALQQQDVGAAQRVGRAAFFELALDVAHGVVAEVAGQAAAEARQAGPQRDLEALLVVGHEVQRVALGGLDDLAVGHDFGDGLVAEARGTQQGARRQADEAVAPEALAAHHRFEQEAVLAAALRMGELEVEGKRGFEVGKGLGHQRDAVVALGAEALEFKFGDHGSFSSCLPALLWPVARSFTGGPESMRSIRNRGRTACAVQSNSQRCMATPGPGSPAAFTCLNDVMNEHGAPSLAHENQALCNRRLQGSPGASRIKRKDTFARPFANSRRLTCSHPCSRPCSPASRRSLSSRPRSAAVPSRRRSRWRASSSTTRWTCAAPRWCSTARASATRPSSRSTRPACTWARRPRPPKRRWPCRAPSAWRSPCCATSTPTSSASSSSRAWKTTRPRARWST